jgi:hypothetical protein
MEAHPNHFNSALDYCVADEPGGGRIVSLNRRSWLFPPHFFKGIPEGYHFMGCGVQRGQFCFRRRGHDKFEDLGDGEDWSIVAWNQVIFVQEDVGTRSTG